MKDNNPISPHIQVYNWHISSLVSISHRITGVINYLLLILVCFWVISLILAQKVINTLKNFQNRWWVSFLLLDLFGPIYFRF